MGQSPKTLIECLPARVSDALKQHARHHASAPAVRDHLGRALTYGQFADAVYAAQQQFRDAGVQAGDRVMLVNENCVPLLVAILALSELSAWPVVVNARMAESELDRIRLHCEPRLVLYFLDSAAAQERWQMFDNEPGNAVLALGGGIVGIRPLPVQPRPDEAALIEAGVFTLIYTTGTTGDPKGVMLTHRNVLYVAAVSSALRGLRADDRVYLVLPVSHVFGLAAVFLAAIYVGAELVLADRFEPATAMATMRDRGITGLFGVPAMFARLVDHARAHGLGPDDMPPLRFMYSGGAPLDPAIKEKTETLFAMPLLNAYGMTESGPTICQVRYNEPLSSCSVGRLLPGLEARLLDTDGKPVAPGEVGELHIRGPNIMLGYYRNPQATAASLDVDGFLNTGDLVRLDDTGNVHIAGRSKELIIHSGFNVYPPEVEGVISTHPGVLLCAVVGQHIDGNEEVVAWVQRAADSDLSEIELQAFIRPLLTAYKRPSRILFMEQLPTAPSGKVLKHKLKQS
ncbi:MAG: class I adenylate-forming enzyme family protein [Pseudohongiella sp.]|uniref:class I adenylate-forming enzyme family protein n=1 Tax=Pseudohongiella sp. TaxID=1979412 RepID=UPI0034A087CF